MQSEARATPDSAPERDARAHADGVLATQGEAESQATIAASRGEEGLEDPVVHFARDAGTVVSHGDHDRCGRPIGVDPDAWRRQQLRRVARVLD
jgi:hypothetical protein